MFQKILQENITIPLQEVITALSEGNRLQSEFNERVLKILTLIPDRIDPDVMITGTGVSSTLVKRERDEDSSS